MDTMKTIIALTMLLILLLLVTQWFVSGYSVSAAEPGHLYLPVVARNFREIPKYPPDERGYPVEIKQNERTRR